MWVLYFGRASLQWARGPRQFRREASLVELGRSCKRLKRKLPFFVGARLNTNKSPRMAVNPGDRCTCICYISVAIASERLGDVRSLRSFRFGFSFVLHCGIVGSATRDCCIRRCAVASRSLLWRGEDGLWTAKVGVGRPGQIEQDARSDASKTAFAP